MNWFGHEPLGVGVRKRIQQQSVDDTEHGGRHADAQREGRDDDSGKAGSLAQNAQTVPQVGAQGIEH
jgi:hypothetical protein